jgi:acyl-CoA thioesterase
VPTFFELSTPRRLGPDHFVLDVPDGHQQGRGAFGGLVLSALSRAALARAARDDQSLRTLTAELCGPVLPGEAQIRVELLRAGSGTSTLAVRLVQNDEVQTHAVVVLGRARAREPRIDPAPPAMPAFERCKAVLESANLPPFARSFTYWDTAESGAAVASGWLRANDPGPVRDAPFLVGMADVWWPALLQTMPVPRPMATLTFTLDILGNCEGLAPDAPLYHEGRTLAVRDGWAPEQRTLWGEDGRLLAINHQTFVVIK